MRPRLAQTRFTFGHMAIHFHHSLRAPPQFTRDSRRDTQVKRCHFFSITPEHLVLGCISRCNGRNGRHKATPRPVRSTLRSRSAFSGRLEGSKLHPTAREFSVQAISPRVTS